MESFDTPALPHKLDGQPVEQLWMRGLRAGHAEVAGCRDECLAKVMLPDPIDDDSGSQRMIRFGTSTMKSDIIFA